MSLGSELNPHHPIVSQMRDHWHKFCAILMLKQGVGEIEITEEDIERMTSLEGGVNITIQETQGRLFLRLVSDEEAIRLARENGGLPS